MILVSVLLWFGANCSALPGDQFLAIRPLPTPSGTPSIKAQRTRVVRRAQPALIQKKAPTLVPKSELLPGLEAEPGKRRNRISLTGGGLAIIYPIALGSTKERVNSKLGFEAHALLFVPAILGQYWRARVSLGLQNYGIPNLSQISISQWLVFAGVESKFFKEKNKFQPFAAAEAGTVFSHLSYDKSLGNPLSNTGFNYGVRIRAGTYFELSKRFKLSAAVPLTYALGSKNLLTSGLALGIKYDL